MDWNDLWIYLSCSLVSSKWLSIHRLLLYSTCRMLFCNAGMLGASNVFSYISSGHGHTWYRIGNFIVVRGFVVGHFRIGGVFVSVSFGCISCGYGLHSEWLQLTRVRLALLICLYAVVLIDLLYDFFGIILFGLLFGYCADDFSIRNFCIIVQLLYHPHRHYRFHRHLPPPWSNHPQHTQSLMLRIYHSFSCNIYYKCFLIPQFHYCNIFCINSNFRNITVIYREDHRDYRRFHLFDCYLIRKFDLLYTVLILNDLPDDL